MKQLAQQLAEWYAQQARPFFEKNVPDRISDFDHDCERLAESAAALGRELSICFLGNSGVGKSTLINALVAQGHTVVPSGGVGPLTAQALSVSYGKEPRIEAEYHGPGRLWQLVFGLENAWKQELGAPKEQDDAPADILIEEEPESSAADAVEPSFTEEKQRGRLEARNVAELLVTGGQNQDTPIAYLIDSLRESLGFSRKWGTEPKQADADRITRIRRVLQLGKSGERYVREGSTEELRQDLADHGSGFLAPLIKTLSVRWASTLLSDGITLIDLPGLGIVGDPRPEITRNYIREKANAVVLVVDNRGVTEPVARLLRESEFLAKLLHAADDPTGNPVLVVAVTRVDDIADSEYSSDGNREFAEYFADVCQRTIPMVRSQLRGEIEQIWHEDGELGAAKKAVIDNLLETLQVYPLSAVQYRHLASRKRSYLDYPDQTNVPAMIAGLRSLRLAQERKQQAKVKLLYDTLLEGVSSTVRLIEAQWSNENRRVEEIEQLRKDLETFIGPLRRQFDTLQGQYREFLRATVPNRITDLVKTAATLCSPTVYGEARIHE